ncbi:hypothetical protein [Flavobacterium sp.]|uniref:hypothetical protein n=1 Tax=Flavobacterium sp. TaxID=239 RepID=UPI0025C4EBAB|nr:hypothetical protein [Flavobacterium sp.]
MKSFISIILGIAILAVGFFWLMLGASSHNIPASSHFSCAVILLVLSTLFWLNMGSREK